MPLSHMSPRKSSPHWVVYTLFSVTQSSFKRLSVRQPSSPLDRRLSGHRPSPMSLSPTNRLSTGLLMPVHSRVRHTTLRVKFLGERCRLLIRDSRSIFRRKRGSMWLGTRICSQIYIMSQRFEVIAGVG